MDGRGRLAEPLKRPGPMAPGRRARASAPPRGFRLDECGLPPFLTKIASRISSFMRFWIPRIEGARIPRFTGIVTSARFPVPSFAYGGARGDHSPMIADRLK